MSLDRYRAGRPYRCAPEQPPSYRAVNLFAVLLAFALGLYVGMASMAGF